MEAISLSLLIFTVYTFTVLAYCLIRKSEINVVRTIYINFIILYILFLVTFSFLPINMPQEKGFNYIPFAKFFKADTSELYKNIVLSVLSILLFVPAGFLTGMFCKLKAFDHIILYSVMSGLLISLIIEVAQLYLPFNRICDVDEIIFNVVGSFIGSFIFYVICRKKFMLNILRKILYY